MVVGADILMFFKDRVPVYLQAEHAECSLACIGMVAAYWGKEYDLPTLRQRFPVSMRGANLKDMVQVAQSLGLIARPLKAELLALKRVILPVILHWGFDHFVVLTKVSRDHVVIHDPAVGKRRISLAELSDGFTGILLDMQPTIEFRREKSRKTISFFSIFGQTAGLFLPLMQILLFSLFVQVAILVIPFYSQVAIDQAVPSGDLPLLKMLAIGFGIFFILNPVAAWLRQRLIIFITAQFSVQLMRNQVKYLMSLPVSYFEKRSVGDLLTRLDASERLRDLITHGFILSVIDIIMLMISIIMMFYYSYVMGLVVLCACLLVVFFRILFVPIISLRVNETLQQQGRQQGELIESLKGAMSVKFARKETERESVWSSVYTAYINCDAKLQATQANYGFIKDLIISLSGVISIYIGINLVMTPGIGFTVGAFVAFESYRSIFNDKLSSFLDQLVEFSLARVHLERLTDILYAEPEQEPSQYRFVVPKFEKIDLIDLGYSFDSERGCVFSGFNAVLNKGDRIMIFGPSGTGKTTLLKVIAGVYAPSSGVVRCNGAEIDAKNQRYLRSMVSAVLQSDRLFSGSILENITFFDQKPDVAFAIECAKLACIHGDISSFSMSYETLVGEVSSTLSQGQQQRVLIARALYQRAEILILDEGTAHLDERFEIQLLENIRNLGVTVVMAVHKEELGRFCNKIWRFGCDGIIESEK